MILKVNVDAFLNELFGDFRANLWFSIEINEQEMQSIVAILLIDCIYIDVSLVFHAPTLQHLQSQFEFMAFDC